MEGLANSTNSTIEIIDAVKEFSVRRGLLKRGRLAAVDHVSFSVYEGEILGLVGESGCGKTTIGRCILHLLPLDGGSIRYGGQEISRLTEAQFYPFRRHIQMIFQDPRSSFDPLFSVEDSIMESLSLRSDLKGKSAKEEIAKLLRLVGFSAEIAKTKVHNLSGGQLQRVALARALAPNSKFLFLDEPTSALDMSIRGQIINLLLDIQQKTMVSYLFVTHDLRLIRAIADRIVVMYLGQIVEEAGKNDLFARPLHPYTQGLLAASFIGKESKKKKRLSLLQGEVVSSGDDYQGCKLAPRCQYVQQRCREEKQLLKSAEPGHQVRCWRVLSGS